MRARCERHGLALGPSGCLLCRREGSSPVGAAAPGAAAAAAAAPLLAAGPAPMAALPAKPPTAALAAPAPLVQPAVSAPAPPASPPAANAAPFAPVPVLPTQGVPRAQRSPLPEAPAAPATVTDNPPSLRLSIRVHPLALVLVPVSVVAVLLFAVLLSGPAQDTARAPGALLAVAEPGAAAAEGAAHPQDDEGTNDAPADDAPAEPLLPVEQAAKKTAELERLHAKVQQEAEREQLLTAARGRLKVKVYYKQDCNSCSEARRHLAARGVRAEEHDIDQEPRARARHRSLNSRGKLPTIEVEGKVLQGFQAKKLDQALDRAASARLKRER